MDEPSAASMAAAAGPRDGGIEIVRFTRIPGSGTLSLHSGPGTVSTPGAINSLCADLFRGAGITVSIKGDEHECYVRYRPAEA